jgi:hypothetical protein
MSLNLVTDVPNFSLFSNLSFIDNNTTYIIIIINLYHIKNPSVYSFDHYMQMFLTRSFSMAGSVAPRPPHLYSKRTVNFLVGDSLQVQHKNDQPAGDY